jgi:N-acetylmuramoyl-L-alanine amidase
MLRLRDHWLEGPAVTRRETPNLGGSMSPRFLVYHYTAGRNAESSAHSLCRPDSMASAHLVLARDGRIIQLAPFHRVTWHAGVSHWAGVTGLNRHSIGIEMDNAGLLKRVGDRYVAWFGAAYPADEVMLAEHRHGGGVQPWHAYSEQQIERSIELAELLCRAYGISEVLGHEDIARGRKVDPGPAFPLAAVAARVVGRTEDDFPLFTVSATALNIREGPDARFEPVAPALPRGTQVRMLESGERWCRVEVVGPVDIEGWVHSSFLAPVANPATGRAQGAIAGPRQVPIDTSGAPASAPTTAPASAPSAATLPATRSRRPATSAKGHSGSRSRKPDPESVVTAAQPRSAQEPAAAPATLPARRRRSRV